MSTFETELERMLGQGDALTDIRVVVRQLWHYAFDGFDLRVWDGKGVLHTSDGNQWLGTVDQNGTNVHKHPAVQDGRDGSAATYRMSLVGLNKTQYDEIKANRDIAKGRPIYVYQAIFKEDEALRLETPLSFLKEMFILDVKFSESASLDSASRLVTNYTISASAKDNNFGRANRPQGTYTPAIQEERARQLGETTDRGCEYVADLATKTFDIR